MREDILIYPNSNHGNVDGMFQGDVNKMITIRCEWCQPHVNIISSFIHTIDQITHNTRIMTIFRKNIDIRWIGSDLTTKKEEFPSREIGDVLLFESSQDLLHWKRSRCHLNQYNVDHPKCSSNSKLIVAHSAIPGW